MPILPQDIRSYLLWELKRKKLIPFQALIQPISFHHGVQLSSYRSQALSLYLDTLSLCAGAGT